MKVAVGIYGPAAWTVDRKYVDGLRRQFPGVEFVQANSDRELAEALRDADVTFSSVVREEAFRGAKNLKWIHASAAGVGATLFPALVESDVILTNSKGVMHEWIAEHVLAVILAWRREIHTSVRRQTQRVWAQDEIASVGMPPFGETGVLLVGMGTIGQATAALLRAVGFQVEGVGRSARDGQHGIESLQSLLGDADIVVLSPPHTKATHHLFDAPMLARMKRGSLLVNVGRGKLVDEPALIDALRQGRPGAAALDVFDHEPLATDSPLWEMENVILTPHVAGFGYRFWDELVGMFARNLDRWLKGEPLLNIVDKRAGY